MYAASGIEDRQLGLAVAAEVRAERRLFLICGSADDSRCSHKKTLFKGNLKVP
jgi:hypothetical protein